jgi:hypothetical protein
MEVHLFIDNASINQLVDNELMHFIITIISNDIWYIMSYK